MSPMSELGLFALLLLILLGASALILSAIRRRRKMPPQRVGAERAKSMSPLLQAASAACDAATREGMAISSIIRTQYPEVDPVAWFAKSMSAIIPIYRLMDGRDFERQPEPVNSASDASLLYIRSDDLKVYLTWARTVM
jgi:hypothetical protein